MRESNSHDCIASAAGSLYINSPHLKFLAVLSLHFNDFPQRSLPARLEAVFEPSHLYVRLGSTLVPKDDVAGDGIEPSYDEGYESSEGPLLNPAKKKPYIFSEAGLEMSVSYGHILERQST